MSELLIITVAVVLIILAFFIFHRWQYGVIILFAWLYIEDIIRRVIPGQPPHVMLVKDALIFLTYCSFFAAVAIRKQKLQLPLISPFFILAAISLIGTFNPAHPGILIAIIGLRTYLWYVPLFLMGFYMFKDWEHLAKFCRILVYTSIPLFALAIVQYVFYFQITMWLFQPLETEHLVHSFDGIDQGIKQIPSVFGNSSRYGRVSMLLFFLGLALLSCRSFSKKQKRILIVSTLCAFLGIATSGKRSPFFLSVIGFILIAARVGLLGLSVPFQHGIFKRVRRARGSLLIIPVGLFFLLLWMHDLRLYYSYVETERLSWFIGELRVFAEAGFLGYGTGTMSQGLSYISSGYGWQEDNLSLRGGGFEAGFSKILFELGTIGFFVFYVFLFLLFFYMRKDLNKLNFPAPTALGVSIFVFSLCIITWFSFLHHQTLGDGTSLTIFWFFNGVLFSLKRLENEQVKLEMGKTSRHRI